MITAALSVIIVLALLLYVLTGGADFGSGLWDLLAFGPRAQRQRDALAHAIGPIWEANHVWLIVVIVVLFVCFPRSYAVISTALHIPLTIMLIGIVLRGAAFVFRKYDAPDKRRLWSLVFAIASVVSPVMLGLCVGASASGKIHVAETGLITSGFLAGWNEPFAWSVGGLTLSLCAFLAAVYMTCEELESEALREDFRRRALGAAGGVGFFAFFALIFAADGAPIVADALMASNWALLYHILTGICALGVGITLVRRQYRLARIFAVGQSGFIVIGWALAQYPYIVYPDLTFDNTAAPESVLRPVLITLALGTLLIAPAFAYLYRIFKGPTFTTLKDDPDPNLQPEGQGEEE